MPITIRQSQAKLGENVRQIAPTLIIGLGGTGKEILLRIRRRFFERFGEVGFPLISYLWIDTDMRNLDLEGQKYDYLMEKVSFQPEERFDAQVSGTSFASYFRDRESHPNIFSWLDPSLAAYGQVVDGAGQKRPFGRLAFFHNHHRLRERLLGMKNAVLDQRATDRLAELCRRHGVNMPQVDRGRLDLLFVFSIAGGTGSGMFLDAAFFCREVLTGNSPNLTAYLLLPSVFNPDVNSQGGQVIFANGYAALKELEHFSLAKDLLERHDDASPEQFRRESDHLFRVEWTRGEPRSLPGPPFNTCYILDNQPRASREALSPGDKMNLCDMVAEAVFLDFNEGNFAAQKRSTRSNLEQFLLSKVDMDYEDRESHRLLFTDVFSCRFSSFGLTKLFVPADRIRRSCAYRLSIDLLDSLAASPPAPGDISHQVRKHHFAPMGLDENLLLRALKRVGDNTEDLLADELAKLVSDQEVEWREALPEPVSSSVQSFREKLRREMSQDSDPRARPGDYLARIRLANPRALASRLFGRFDPDNDDLWAILNDDPGHTDTFGVAPTGSIGRVVRGWLDDTRFRLPLARAYLKAAAALFREEIVPRWRQEAEDQRETARAFDENVDRRVRMLESEEESRGKLLPSKRALLRRLRRDLTSWTAAWLDEMACRAAVEFAERSLLPYLERLDRFLGSLEEDLRRVRDELTERRAAFEAGKFHQIFDEVLDRDILENSYRLRTADGFVRITPELLQRFEGDLLKSLQVRGAADLSYTVALQGRQGLANALEALAFERFSDLPVRFDVLEEFSRIRAGKMEDELRKWVRRGSIWLAPGEVAERFSDLDRTLMDLVFLGAPKTEKQENLKLIELIQNTVIEKAAPRTGSVQKLDTVGTDSVYIYSEVAGVSLPSIRLIDRYLKDAYLSARRRESVHIDFHEENFPQEVVLREFQEVRSYLRIYRLLLLGTITGVLRNRLGSTGRLSWSFMDLDRRPPQPVELGPELFALNTLLRQEDLARRVEATMTQAVRGLSPARLTDLYAVLVANLGPEGSFPLRWRYRGGGTEEVSSHGRHILDDEARRLEDLAKSKGTDKAFFIKAAAARDLGAISHTVPWQDPPLRVLTSSILEGGQQEPEDEVRDAFGRTQTEDRSRATGRRAQ
jgi:hypothetical protein